MSVVDQAIQDAVGDGRVADLIMPMRDRDLAGEHGGTIGITIVTDFEKVSAFAIS